VARVESRSGKCLKRRSPGLQARASGNVETVEANNVMNNSSTAISNVIPFRFEAKEVRTLLIEDQPWFCAADVCAVLGYVNSRKAIADNCREAGVTASDISSGGQKRRVTFISEGNLYRLIIKSRKEEAKRFEAWVCDEVLPAIRKHGRYEDSSNKMTTLVNDVIGVSGTNLINGVISQKITILPVGVQRQAKHKLHSILHTRFNVPRTELIPAEKLDVACEYLAAYALEGEWLGKESKRQPNLNYPIATLVERRASMLTVRNNTQAWLDVTLHDLRDIRGSETPCEKLLGELSKAGYDIEGCWWELRTYRNKVRELASFAIGLNRAIEDPHRYAVSPTS
jgi:prophage antirepressor-like protein